MYNLIFTIYYTNIFLFVFIVLKRIVCCRNTNVSIKLYVFYCKLQFFNVTNRLTIRKILFKNPNKSLIPFQLDSNYLRITEKFIDYYYEDRNI